MPSLLLSQNKVFTFSEGGIFVDYIKHLPSYGKTAIAYNDSIIIVGLSSGLAKRVFLFPDTALH